MEESQTLNVMTQAHPGTPSHPTAELVESSNIHSWGSAE